MGSNQRRHERYDVSLDFCLLRHDSGRSLLCILRNISRSGLMLEMSMEEDISIIKMGDMIMLDDFPEELDELIGDRNAEVVWISDTLCGLRLASNISATDEQLLALQEQYDLDPWEDMPEDFAQLLQSFPEGSPEEPQ